MKTKQHQGQQIEVRGIQNVAQHVEVPSQECKDKSGANYPNGLVCSGEQGQWPFKQDFYIRAMPVIRQCQLEQDQIHFSA